MESSATPKRYGFDDAELLAQPTVFRPGLFAGQTVLVSGAGSGLGKAVATLFARLGARLAICGRNPERLEAAAGLLRGLGAEVIAVPMSIRDPAQVQALIERVWAEAGGLDLLVNNAGIGHYAEFAEEDPAIIDRILQLNVTAPFDLTRRAAKHMKARGRGQILEISSVLGEFGIPYSATYVASKHAVNGLVKSLRHELKGTGVRVWAALPGRFASEFRFRSLGDRDEPSKPVGVLPAEVVARGILKGLDRRSAFHSPTFSAWATVAASRVFRGPFDWFIGVWGTRQFGREMGRGGESP